MTLFIVRRYLLGILSDDIVCSNYDEFKPGFAPFFSCLRIFSVIPADGDFQRKREFVAV